MTTPPSPAAVPHPVLVGVGAGLDIFGTVILTHARRVPLAQKQRWRRSVVVTMVSYWSLLMVTLLASVVLVVTERAPEWSVAPACALMLAPTVCVEVLTRQQRRRS